MRSYLRILMICTVGSAAPLGCCGSPAPAIALVTDAGTFKVLLEGMIFVDGKQGLLIKYEATAVDEPKNLSDAKDIFAAYQARAEARGLRLVTIVAVVPEKRVGPFYSNKTYSAGFERGADGLWKPIPPRRHTDAAVPLPVAMVDAGTGD